MFEHVNYANHLSGSEVTYAKYPKLEAFHQRMANLPNLKEYLEGEHHAATAATFVPCPPAKVNIN